MNRTVSLVSLTLILLLAAGSANADCSAPAKPGVRICTPTANSTVVYEPEISVNSTAEAGTHITGFYIYDNGKVRYHSSPGQTGINLYDATILDGTHHVTVKAWDSAGHVLEAETTFTVVGQGFPFCSTPSKPGINFCMPPSGAIVGVEMPVGAAAKGDSTIKTLSVFVDGKLATSDNTNAFATGVNTKKQGPHTISWVALDTTGHTFKASRQITASYTYDLYGCPTKGNGPCSPGFNNTSPAPDSYVGTSFTLKADIKDNPEPIKEMKAYIDGTLVATSSGPTMLHPISNAPHGTHILTFWASDTKGVIYRVQYNIDIDVSH